MLALFALFALVATTSALSCADLGLISGGNPKTTTVQSYSGTSPQTSSITWSASSTTDSSLTSTVTCAEGTGADSDKLVITSSGVPAHRVGAFPMRFDTTGKGHNDNPNTISQQSFSWTLPKNPQIKTRFPESILENSNALPLGPIGFALNGVPVFNPFNSNKEDAVSRNSSGYEVMDLCHGHPDMHGRYHYHYQEQTDGCLFGSTNAQIVAEAGKRSPKIAYAFDGIPIYGPLGKDGVAPTDLDKCNGRMDTDLGQYVYHTTDGKAPYIIGCYRYRATQHSGPPPVVVQQTQAPTQAPTQSPTDSLGATEGDTEKITAGFKPTSQAVVAMPALITTVLALAFRLLA